MAQQTDFPLPAPQTTINVAASEPVPPTPVKPGHKTTEFILTTLTMVFGSLLTSGILAPGSLPLQIVGAASVVLSALGYTYSRTVLKAAAGLVFIGVLGTSLGACAEGRDAVIAKTLASTESLRVSFLAIDGDHQADLVAAAPDRATAVAAVAAYQEARKKVNLAFFGAYGAISFALAKPDQVHLTALAGTVVKLLAALADAGVLPRDAAIGGGGK